MIYCNHVQSITIADINYHDCNKLVQLLLCAAKVYAVMQHILGKLLHNHSPLSSPLSFDMPSHTAASAFAPHHVVLAP